MRARSLFLSAFLLGAVAAASAAGCSEDLVETPLPDGGNDDGGDASLDVAADAPVNCATDEDSDGLKRHLECAGFYSDFATKTVAAENRPFKPAIEFWSDGAAKSRWVYLPPGTTIGITNFDAWVYPNGMKLWKEFKVGGKLIETRLYMKDATGTWNHTAYRWNDTETSAARRDQGQIIPGIGPDGGSYEVPNTGHCNECHDNKAEPVLGFDAIGLGLTGATGVTLAVLASENKFASAPPVTTLSIPGDPLAADAGTGRLAAGWLHANCGGCHNDVSNNGGGLTGFHMMIKPTELLDGGNFATLAVSRTGMCCSSSRGNPNDAGANYPRFAGGDVTNSLAAYLAGNRGEGGPNSVVQMPPLVTRAVDHAGYKLLTDWIMARPACAAFPTCQ